MTEGGTSPAPSVSAAAGFPPHPTDRLTPSPAAGSKPHPIAGPVPRPRRA